MCMTNKMKALDNEYVILNEIIVIKKDLLATPCSIYCPINIS